MSKAASAMAGIHELEELSARDTFVHRRRPEAHLLVTLLFAGVLSSYGKYEISAMLPLLLYPVFVLSVGDIPASAVLRRLLPALPFALGLGLFNPLFDRGTVAVAGFVLSAGWLSLLSIFLRLCLSVAVALLLVGVCGMGGLSSALRSFGVPRLITAQLVMTFRYLHVLAGEAGRMSLAYRLRAPGQKGVARRFWGPFAGLLLLRSLERAERVHRAMLCRGYDGRMPEAPRGKFNAADAAYVLAWAAFFAAARFFDIPREIGALLLVLGG